MVLELVLEAKKANFSCKKEFLRCFKNGVLEVSLKKWVKIFLKNYFLNIFGNYF